MYIDKCNKCHLRFCYDFPPQTRGCDGQSKFASVMSKLGMRKSLNQIVGFVERMEHSELESNRTSRD